MSTASPAPSSEIVLLDAQGEVTTDRAKAVSGEVLSTDDDGNPTSTLFVIDKPGQDTVSGP